MQALKLLHRTLTGSSVISHEKRVDSLMRSVASISHNGKLSLTSIGRHMAGDIKVKNKIKSVDRLLENTHLIQEREGIYDVITSVLLAGLKEIEILIDWSSCNSHEQHILKASVVMHGRSMTLYEEIHPEKQLGKLWVHKNFLDKLKKMIPPEINVIVETDAGFRTEWFELILEMGWDFIGRVRSNMLFQYQGKDEWQGCFSTFPQATGRAKFLGKVLLAKSRSLPCSMYIYHEKKSLKDGVKKLKQKRKVTGKMARSSAKGNKEPWLLVTSLKGGQGSANKVIYRYRHRMRIEHEFRSTKNSKWGIGLEHSQCKNIDRLQILLLIGYLAIFILWVTGLAAEQKNLQHNYQANTIKKRRVLSLVYLGLQVVLHQEHLLTELDLINAFKYIRIKS